MRQWGRAEAVFRDDLRAAIWPGWEGFRGFSLTINCEDAQGVFRAHERIPDYDDVADMDEQPEQSGWGCGFSFRDPEGNLWDVAFKHGSDFDHRGGFIYLTRRTLTCARERTVLPYGLCFLAEETPVRSSNYSSRRATRGRSVRPSTWPWCTRGTGAS